MHVRAHAHTKTLKINIHFSFLNHFLGSGITGQFSRRFILFSSQQFFSNSSHTFFEMCFPFSPPMAGCTMNFLPHTFPVKVMYSLTKASFKVVSTFFFFLISPSHLSTGVLRRVSNSLQHISRKPIRIHIFYIHRLCK